MKALIQRVQRASVAVNQTIVGQIQKGFLIFLGVAKDDTSREADVLLKKCLQLRIFEDENGKSNLSLSDVKGELLIISQFTLYADCHKGNRPSFIHAGNPQKAEQLYQYFVEQAKQSRLKVQQGEFGADMKVELLNDGPFTVLLEVEDGKVKALAAGD